MEYYIYVHTSASGSPEVVACLEETYTHLTAVPFVGPELRMRQLRSVPHLQELSKSGVPFVQVDNATDIATASAMYMGRGSGIGDSLLPVTPGRVSTVPAGEPHSSYMAYGASGLGQCTLDTGQLPGPGETSLSPTLITGMHAQALHCFGVEPGSREDVLLWRGLAASLAHFDRTRNRDHDVREARGVVVVALLSAVACRSLRKAPPWQGFERLLDPFPCGAGLQLPFASVMNTRGEERWVLTGALAPWL
jgi:hypothetical protein